MEPTGLGVHDARTMALWLIRAGLVQGGCLPGGEAAEGAGRGRGRRGGSVGRAVVAVERVGSRASLNAAHGQAGLADLPRVPADGLGSERLDLLGPGRQEAAATVESPGLGPLRAGAAATCPAARAKLRHLVQQAVHLAVVDAEVDALRFGPAVRKAIEMLRTCRTTLKR